MTVYLDASALVKLYIAEEQTEETLNLVANAERAVSIVLAIDEVLSGVARVRRMAALSHDAAEVARDRFMAEVGQFYWMRVDRPLVDRAATILWQRDLRAGDAIHLAAALRWATRDTSFVFATFDQRLAEAARAEGLTVWP